MLTLYAFFKHHCGENPKGRQKDAVGAHADKNSTPSNSGQDTSASLFEVYLGITCNESKLKEYQVLPIHLRVQGFTEKMDPRPDKIRNHFYGIL